MLHSYMYEMIFKIELTWSLDPILCYLLKPFSPDNKIYKDIANETGENTATTNQNHSELLNSFFLLVWFSLQVYKQLRKEKVI